MTFPLREWNFVGFRIDASGRGTPCKFNAARFQPEGDLCDGEDIGSGLATVRFSRGRWSDRRMGMERGVVVRLGSNSVSSEFKVARQRR